MTEAQEVKKELNHYIIRNIMANVGLSAYVLVDTLFIAIAAGSLGLTVLNLALPIFNLFNATGLLLGVGGATYFSLNKVRHPERVKSTYSQLIIFAFLLGVAEIILMRVFLDPFLHLLGANAQTMDLGRTYVGFIAFSAPLYMCNYITINFVRNDGNPSLMAVFFSPLCSLLVLSFHIRFKKRQLEWHWAWPKLTTLKTAARLGIAPFMNEMSSGVSIYLFNWTLLKLAGNYAVAAYGVVANIGIMTLAAANGVALGVQPIASREFGKHARQKVIIAYRYGLMVTAGLALALTAILIVFKRPIIDLFNTEHQAALLSYALSGLPIYFTSAVFTAVNILTIIFLTAINRGGTSFKLSLLRGYLILLPMIVLLAFIGGVHGVFAAMPVSELIVSLICFAIMRGVLHQLSE